MYSPKIPSPRGARYPSRQRGVTLIELMVGLAIGLLVVAVAMGALISSRGISGTVSDASNIQQQGAYILRVMGQQLRQAGSLYLNPDPAATGAGGDVLSAVAFEIQAKSTGTGNDFTQGATLSGGTNTVTTGFRRYADEVFMVSGTEATESAPAVSGIDYLARNCAGAPANASTDQLIESIFTFSDNTLRCQGNGVSAQPMAQNVAEFQVTYLVQDPSPVFGTTMRYFEGDDMSSAGLDSWRRVQGVQVCLVLFGNESIPMPAGSSYTDCAGKTVDITELDDERKNRMHLLFRNTFQLRSQGLL